MANGIKVLVAEDDQDIRELVILTLNFNGFETASAINGRDALEKAQNEPFDLILLDVRMPQMTGYEVCRLLRKNEKTQHIPIIMLSAKGQESEIKAGIEAGADEYILKPFAPDILVEKINEVIHDLQNGK